MIEPSARRPEINAKEEGSGTACTSNSRMVRLPLTKPVVQMGVRGAAGRLGEEINVITAGIIDHVNISEAVCGRRSKLHNLSATVKGRTRIVSTDGRVGGDVKTASLADRIPSCRNSGGIIERRLGGLVGGDVVATKTSDTGLA